MKSPGCPSSNSTVPGGKSRANRSSPSFTPNLSPPRSQRADGEPGPGGLKHASPRVSASSRGAGCGAVRASRPGAPDRVLGGKHDLVAVEAELDRADQHLDVPAIAAVAHPERDQRGEPERAHRTDARPAVAIHGIDQSDHDALAEATGGPRSVPSTSSTPRSAIGATSSSTAAAAAGRSPGMNTMTSGDPRQRGEVRLRALARGAVAAAGLAQHERAGVARDLGGAVARRAIDDHDRADRAVREAPRARRPGWPRGRAPVRRRR